MKRNISATLFLSLCLLFAACSQDEGNYDYHDIAAITIDGLEDSYVANLNEGYVFRLNPEVTTTGRESDLEYEWKLQGTTSPDLKSTIVLGRERNLVWDVDSANIGSCNLVYRVKDRASGVTASRYMDISLALRNSGIMVLCENAEGRSQLDLISFAADTVVLRNVLKNFPPLGKPRYVAQVGQWLFTFDRRFTFRWLVTEDDAYQFNEDFEYEAGNDFSANLLLTKDSYDRNAKLLEVHPRNRRNSYGDLKNEVFVCSNGYLFAAHFVFSEPINILADEEGVMLAAPYIFRHFYKYFTGVVYYDRVNERFLYTSTDRYNFYSQRLTDRAGEVFPWNNKEVNRTLVYGGSTFNYDFDSDPEGNCYALMRDKGTDDLYIYRFRVGQSYRFMLKCVCYSLGRRFPDLLRAEHFVFSSKRTALYYSIGSKIYGLDFNPGNERLFELMDYGDAAITDMRLDDQIETDKDFIYVATYNQAEGGTFMKLEQGTDPDRLELREVPDCRWTGFGKIVSWSWK